MAANSTLSQGLANYIASTGTFIELIIGTVQTVNAGNQPSLVVTHQQLTLRNIFTVGADSYAPGDRIIVAMFNIPIALGKVTLNPDH